MFDRELKTAATLARQAGAILLEVYASDFKVDFKSGTDPVTDADRRANTFLVDALRQHFPGDGIIAEESADHGKDVSCPRCWFVDPLDGTREFVARNGEFAVMLGLAIAGRAQLGVVYQPVSDKLYSGAIGRGAWLEQHGSTRALGGVTEPPPDGLRLIVSRSHRSPGTDELVRTLTIRSEQSSGSVGLKVGLIAEDQADLYAHLSGRASKWDTCGPEAIAHAAGVRFTDLFGDPLDYCDPNLRAQRGILACRSAAFDQVVGVVRGIAEGMGFERAAQPLV